MLAMVSICKGVLAILLINRLYSQCCNLSREGVIGGLKGISVLFSCPYRLEFEKFKKSLRAESFPTVNGSTSRASEFRILKVNERS